MNSQGTYQIDMKATVQQSQIRALESDLIRKVNRDIARKVTPIYNTFQLLAAALFAYFIINESN